MTDTSATPPAAAARMCDIAARLTAAGLDAQVHQTSGVLDITATLHQPGRKDIHVILDEDGYAELRYWNGPDATPAQIAALLTSALTTLTGLL